MKDDLVESLLVHDVDEALPPDHERRIREGLGPLLSLPTDPTTPPKADPPAPPAPPAPLAGVAAPLLGKLPVIGLLVLGAAGAGFVAGRATAPAAGSAITTTAPVATLVAPSPVVIAPSIACASPATSAAPSVAAIATPSPAVPARPTPSASDPFDREQSLLERARTALVRHDATAAEQALDECEKEFTKPRHAEERDYLRIQTLRERGDNARARERARAFLVNYPTSLLRGRVQALLVE